MSCILYSTFFDPSFWPAHVMIGEFLEKPRPPRAIAGNLATSNEEEVTITPNEMVNNENNVTANTDTCANSSVPTTSATTTAMIFVDAMHMN